MEKVLDGLLKDTYTVEALEENLTALERGYGVTGFERLEAAVEKLPVVFITLAVELPSDKGEKGENDEIAKIGRWFRQNVDPRILLELRHDPQILGGCVLIWKGVEGDFSLRAKLKRNREESTPE